MFFKRVRPLMVCVLPLSLSLSAGCGGSNDAGSVSVRAQALGTSILSIAGNFGSSLAVRSDGMVLGTGDNPGDGTTTARTSPGPVSALSGITAVTAGIGAGDADYALALRSDGTIFAWGANDHGQLGDGTAMDRTSPVQVSGSGVGTRYTAVAAGATYYSLGISSEGTVFAWGSNVYGQLGDASGVDQATPVKVSGLVLSGVTAVAAADIHGLALKPDGTVWNWGFNGNGELGTGTVGGASGTPVQVTGLTNVTAIAAGNSFSLALKSDGTVFAWGTNLHGQLGDGTTTDRPTAVQVSGLSDITAIAAGREYFALALKSDGTVYAWGNNDSGQLGDGTTTQRDTPVQVTGLSGVMAIKAGRYHSLAQKSDGTIYAWGANFAGQLGDGTTTERHTPVPTRFNGANCSDCASYPMPNPAGTGPNPPSYTSGTGYVVDNMTGLLWEQGVGCATPGCNQADAAAHCASLTLGGYSDWRIPTRIELVSIIDDTKHAPAIDGSVFTGMSGYFWTSTPMIFFPKNAFKVGGTEGDTSYGSTGLNHVRCVHAPAAAPVVPYQLQSGGTPTGTVLDTGTGMTWQQAASPATYTLDDANSYCSSNTPGLPGTGWRLPSMKELQTVVNDSRVRPAIDSSVFPSTPFDVAYWSSTKVAGRPGYAWSVSFELGVSSHTSASTKYHVRCVR